MYNESTDRRIRATSRLDPALITAFTPPSTAPNAGIPLRLEHLCADVGAVGLWWVSHPAAPAQIGSKLCQPLKSWVPIDAFILNYTFKPPSWVDAAPRHVVREPDTAMILQTVCDPLSMCAISPPRRVCDPLIPVHQQLPSSAESPAS